MIAGMFVGQAHRLVERIGRAGLEGADLLERRSRLVGHDLVGLSLRRRPTATTIVRL